MTTPDETSRRYRARIDLSTGRASVQETTPDRRRPRVPSMVDATFRPTRQAPSHGAPQAPQFPWRRDETVAAQPQDAPRHDFPEASPQAAPAEASYDVVDAVVDRVRAMLHLPPEEPPGPLLDLDGASLAQQHVAGAFANRADAPEVESVNPAGAFAASA